jgi:hypothetical protein
MSRGDLGELCEEALGYGVALANRPAFTRHQIHSALMRHELVLDVQRKRGLRHADKLAWGIVDRAVERVKMHPPELWRFEVPDRLRRYRNRADARPWPGRTGCADRRALEAAYLTGFLARSTTFHLAARTWGLRAGMPAVSVNRAAKRLQRQGLIRIERKGTVRIGALYRVRNPRTVTRGLPPREVPLCQLVDITRVGVSLLDELGYERRLLAHDAFRPDALGDSGWMVARWLSDDVPLDVDRLSSSTGIAIARVTEILETLERHGPATGALANGRPEVEVIYRGKPTGGWLRSLEPAFFGALDQIARDAGTFGTLGRERETYAADRAKRDEQYPDTPSELFVTLRDPWAWWSTWWNSLSEGVPRAA